MNTLYKHECLRKAPLRRGFAFLDLNQCEALGVRKTKNAKQPQAASHKAAEAGPRTLGRFQAKAKKYA